MIALLIACAGCTRHTPDTEGDIRNIRGTEISLCAQCVTDWNLTGIPNHIAADLIG